MPSIDEVLEWQKKHHDETGEFISDYYEIKDRIIAERGPDKKEPYMVESCNQESIIRDRNGAGRWMPLTEEEIDEIVRRYKNGEEPKAIADEIGMSVTTIINRLNERDEYVAKPRIRWTPEITEQMRTMYLNGTPRDEICRVIGCTKNALDTKVTELGLFKLKQKMDKEKPLRNGNSESGKEKKL